MRPVVVSLMALLIAGGAVAADDGALLRTEIPEAGLSITFPSGWAVDVEMRERQDWGLYEEGLAEGPVPFWSVLYASAGGRPWCDLTWYPAHPMSLSDHAGRYEALMTPTHADVERTIDVQPESLPAGEARRFVIHNAPTDDYTTVYLVGVDETRYLIRCVADVRTDQEWLSVAASLEVTPSEEQPTDTSSEPPDALGEE